MGKIQLQALTYVSPRAILKALMPAETPTQNQNDSDDDRIAAFVRYIAEKESRGALEDVSEFPPGLTWFNSSPLKLNR